jgi:hypothetical protein
MVCYKAIRREYNFIKYYGIGRRGVEGSIKIIYKLSGGKQYVERRRIGCG